MDVKPHTLAAKITVPFIKGMVEKAVGSDLDGVKTIAKQTADRRERMWLGD